MPGIVLGALHVQTQESSQQPHKASSIVVSITHMRRLRDTERLSSRTNEWESGDFTSAVKLQAGSSTTGLTGPLKP